eukprot:TRINITY_DN619_c1_g1_i2.p1 TRINITY_DN619_c1_g1~~TRINITY_DN619_c1_g1_i2.p1  ORF type:complete len:463 (-),score=63.37 TRINITY_DN619_c1_g1_i2:222-1610(-)
MSYSGPNFSQTPTYSIALVATVFIAISVVAERGIHKLGHFLKKTLLKKALFEALEKMKEEFMLLGILSLLLVFFQYSVVGICIPKPPERFRACPYTYSSESKYGTDDDGGGKSPYPPPYEGRRRLLAKLKGRTCEERGLEPLMTIQAQHDLHLFIFVLAIVHIFNSLMSMLAAFMQVRGWYQLEEKSVRILSQCVGLSPEAKMKATENNTKAPKLATDKSVSRSIWVCFIRHLANHVQERDYCTLRLAFINKHNLEDSFNFHHYILNCLEADFKDVVGLGWHLWAMVIVHELIRPLVDTYVMYVGVVLSLILVLAVGTKLEHIQATLAKEARQSMIMNPRDDLFWFNRPHLVLPFIQIVLFVNSFQFAEFLFLQWRLKEYEYDCLRGSLWWNVSRILIGLVVQFICSSSTLPLYALISQLGDNYKGAIFSEHMQHRLKQWLKHTRLRRRTHATPIVLRLPEP